MSKSQTSFPSYYCYLTHDIKLNTRREIPYLRTPVFYSLFQECLILLSGCSILVLEGLIDIHLILFISIGLLMPSDSSVTSTAILVSNSTNEGLNIINSKECIKNRQTLERALLKSGWKCGMVLFRND